MRGEGSFVSEHVGYCETALNACLVGSAARLSRYPKTSGRFHQGLAERSGVRKAAGRVTIQERFCFQQLLKGQHLGQLQDGRHGALSDRPGG